MRIRTVLYRALLALTLLVGQQAASLHELSHGLEDIARKKEAQEPLGHVCERCLAFSSLGHAIASFDLPVIGPEVSFARPTEKHPSSAECLLHLAYLSRAPPSLS